MSLLGRWPLCTSGCFVASIPLTFVNWEIYYLTTKLWKIWWFIYAVLKNCAGPEYNFAHFIWISRYTIYFKSIIGWFFWQKTICFSVSILVPFTNGHDKSLFTNSGVLSCYSLCWFRVSFIGIFLEMFFTPVQAYHHASSVIQSLREDNLNLTFLVQIDKLIHLLESPIFAYLRLQVILMA